MLLEAIENLFLFRKFLNANKDKMRLTLKKKNEFFVSFEKEKNQNQLLDF